MFESSTFIGRMNPLQQDPFKLDRIDDFDAALAFAWRKVAPYGA